MPTPLPGYEEAEPLQALVSQAAGLLQSPRLRESDAGGMLACDHLPKARCRAWLEHQLCYMQHSLSGCPMQR